MKIKIQNAFEEEQKVSPGLKIKVGTSAPVREEDENTAPSLKIKINQPMEEVEDSSEPDIKIRINPTVDEEQEEVAPIKIKIGDTGDLVVEEEPEDKKKITIKVGDQSQPKEEPKKIQKTMRLIARRTLNGDIMIFDHKDIDIVIKLSKGKVAAFPKEEYDDKIYETQTRLFEYLARKGIIEYESIQGGNMFMAMEAKLLESDDYDVPQITLVTIGKWIERERPYFEWQEKWEEEQERKLLEPEEGEYTEFDPEKYHAAEKGSIRPKAVPFGTPGIYRF